MALAEFLWQSFLGSIFGEFFSMVPGFWSPNNKAFQGSKVMKIVGWNLAAYDLPTKSSPL